MNYDKEKAKELIKKEMRCNNSDAERLAHRIQYLHPSLEPYVQLWLNGKNEEYSFHGVSTTIIMEKERCSYIIALYRMSSLIKNPHFIDSYLKRELYIQ